MLTFTPEQIDQSFRTAIWVNETTVPWVTPFAVACHLVKVADGNLDVVRRAAVQVAERLEELCDRGLALRSTLTGITRYHCQLTDTEREQCFQEACPKEGL